jgi:phosphate starvation-inducible PhoH-like protein
VVFCIGPAGTGKTYLAVAKAVQALQAKQVNRIILTRPAVEAGERLGFLPGTLYEKIDPSLRPLYDALHDMIDPDSIPRLMARARSRWHRWRICAAGPSTTRSSSSTRRRTPARSR